MPRLASYLGRWIRHGGWYPDRKVRVVRRGHARWGGTNPHDKLEVDGQIMASPAVVGNALVLRTAKAIYRIE